MGVMFVGATNVGQIILSFDPEIRGNQLLSQAIVEKSYARLPIQKGEELGQFRMGSTIVMLYSKDTLPKDLQVEKFLNQQVRVNSSFA